MLLKVPDISQPSFEQWLETQTLSNFDFNAGLRDWLKDTSGYDCIVADDFIQFHNASGVWAISTPQWIVLLLRRLNTASKSFTPVEAIDFINNVQRY